MFTDTGDQYGLDLPFATSPQVCLCMPSSYINGDSLINSDSNFFGAKVFQFDSVFDTLKSTNIACYDK